MRNLDDFREEIRAHVELEADRLREQGLSLEQARAAARRSFGNVAAVEERYYDSRGSICWRRTCASGCAC